MNDQRNRNLLFPEVILFRLRGNPSSCMQRNDWCMNMFYLFDVHVWSGLTGFRTFKFQSVFKCNAVADLESRVDGEGGTNC